MISFYANFMMKTYPELTEDAAILKKAFELNTEEFCNVASLDDSRYCVQEPVAEKISDTKSVVWLCLQKIGNTDFKDVTIMTHANDDSDRMFLVEETGIGRIMYPNGDIHPEPFFDIRDRVAQFIWRGRKQPSVLGITFHPNFKSNGLLYVYFIRTVNKADGRRINSLGELKSGSGINKTDPGYFRLILDVVQQLDGYTGGQVMHLSLIVRKPVFGVSDQVRHKPGCTATEDS